MANDVPPGWYQAAGDPPGTVRWWTGIGWYGDPVPGEPSGAFPTPVPGANPQPSSSSQPTQAASPHAVPPQPASTPEQAAVPQQPAAQQPAGPQQPPSTPPPGWPQAPEQPAWATQPARQVPQSAWGNPQTGWTPAANAVPTVHGRVIVQTGRRFGAALLDYLFQLLLAIPTIAATLASINWDDVANGKPITYEPNLTLSIVTQALGVAYTVIPVAIWGATAGKAILGMRIIRGSDGVSPPGWGTAILRALPNALVAVIAVLLSTSASSGQQSLGSISALLPIVSLILMTRDPMCRSVNDRIAKTYVVEHAKPKP